MEKAPKIPEPASGAPSLSWRRGTVTQGARTLPEEVAVALTYDRVSFAVMMATPLELEDFALGFSLSEGIIEAPSDITELEIVALETGVECRMSLAPARRDPLAARRRKIAGPVGCGLCGIDSLEQAVRQPRLVQSTLRIPAAAIAAGFARMARLQTLNQQTRAVHAAAFLTPDGNVLVREDVGRHNALDKLIGAAARSGTAGASGAVLLTSRVSIDLIQKTAILGAPILAAISVPTARALRAAQAAGLTLIAVARDDGFEIFTHPDRIILDAGTQGAVYTT
jgi:FdhD protein